MTLLRRTIAVFVVFVAIVLSLSVCAFLVRRHRFERAVARLQDANHAHAIRFQSDDYAPIELLTDKQTSFVTVAPLLPDFVRSMTGEGVARRYDTIVGIGVARSKAGALDRLGVESQLRHVEVFESELNQGDTQFLARCMKLESLRILGTGITDEFCEIIGQKRTLQLLSIKSEQNLTSTGLIAVAGPDLKTLSVVDCPRVDDLAIERIAAERKLQDVSLDGKQFGDSVIEQVLMCGQLKNVSLNGTDISDAGARLFAHAPMLDTIVISDCDRITSEGLDALLSSARFRILIWFRNRMSDAEFEKLKKKHNAFIWRGEKSALWVWRP